MANFGIGTLARHRRENSGQGAEPGDDLGFFHHAARACERARDPDGRRRSGRGRGAAGGAIPRCGAADRAGHYALSRRQRPHRHRRRRLADRAAGERRRGHDLHAVVQRCRRQLFAHGDVQDRRRPQHCAGPGAEPGVERALLAAASSAGAGRDRAEELDGDPADRDADVARLGAGQPLSLQLRDHQAQGRGCAAPRCR